MNHTRLLILTYSVVVFDFPHNVLLNYTLIKPLCTQENNRIVQLNCHKKELHPQYKKLNKLPLEKGLNLCKKFIVSLSY